MRIIRYAAILAACIVAIGGLWWLFGMPPRDVGSPLEVTRRRMIAVIEQVQKYHQAEGRWPEENDWEKQIHRQSTTLQNSHDFVTIRSMDGDPE